MGTTSGISIPGHLMVQVGKPALDQRKVFTGEGTAFREAHRWVTGLPPDCSCPCNRATLAGLALGGL
jgi:hypothetical protein